MILARSLLALILLLLIGRAAFADGYSDFNAGVAAGDRDDHDGAIKHLSAALTEADLPDHLRPTAFLARALQYSIKQQYDLAMADFAQAAALKPLWPDIYFDRCLINGLQKIYDKALADCSTAIQLLPENWQLRHVRAGLYVVMKAYDNALYEYSAAIAARPRDPGLLIERGGLYQMRGEFDKALSDLGSAKALIPTSPEPEKAMARLYYAEGDFQKSVESDDAAIAKAPGDASAYGAKGQALWAMGKFDDAAAAYTITLQRFGVQPYAFIWLSLAQSRRHGGIPTEYAARFANVHMLPLPTAAVQLFLGKAAPETLLQLTGDDPESGGNIQCSASFYVGAWYEGQGDSNKARRLLQTAVELCDPNSGMRESAVVELGRLQ